MPLCSTPVEFPSRVISLPLRLHKNSHKNCQLEIHPNPCFSLAPWPGRHKTQRRLRALNSDHDPQPRAEEEDLLTSGNLFEELGNSPQSFVVVATIFNGAMLGGSLLVGKFAGIHIGEGLLPPYNLWAGVGCVLPLVGLMLAVAELDDKFPEIREIKVLLQKTIIPLVQSGPVWVPALIALGAGFGEEALYRGLIQAGAINALTPEIGEQVANCLGIVITGVLFGYGHALNSIYFWWATFAGMYFGLESMLFGLSSAATTHMLYDWIALVYLSKQWSDDPGTETNGTS